MPYFHVVFTVPEQVAAVALGNKKLVYEILFRAAAQTLLEVARDPKHLGAAIGFLAILHTWTQTRPPRPLREPAHRSSLSPPTRARRRESR